MRNNKTALLTIQIIVVAFVFIAILIIFISYYKQQKNYIAEKYYDEQILKEFKTKQTKKYKVKKTLSTVFSAFLTLIILGALSVGVVTKLQGNVFGIGSSQVLLVESSSMSSRNSSNVYLDEYNLNNQIDLYDLVIIDKLPEEKDLQLFDVVVYKRGDMLVIHRIISIDEPNEKHPEERYFRLRGDSNNASDEYPVKYSDMVAIYSGNKIPIVGFFIAFLQSALGILAIGIVILYLIITTVQEYILDKEEKKRLDELLNLEKQQTSSITNIFYLNSQGEPNYYNRVIHLLDTTVVTVQNRDLIDISDDKFIENNPNFEIFDETERQHYQRLINSSLPIIEPVIIPPVIERNELSIKKRSFVDKLRISKKDIKEVYKEIKLEALSYGLKPRMSFSGETFRLHTKTYLKITISGKSIKVFYALNAKDYENSPIPLIDYSSRNSKADTPSALWVKSDLALKRAKILIGELCEKDGLVKKEINPNDYIDLFTDELVEETVPQEPVIKEEPVIEEIVVVEENNKLSLNIVKKSFTEKLTNSDDELRKYYNRFKSTALSYGLKPRMSFSGETFRLQTKTYLKITISGKSLKIFYALNAKNYEDSPIPLIDYSSRNSKVETPSALWVKSDLAFKRAVILLNDVCEKDHLSQGPINYKDWIELMNSTKKEINIKKTSFEDKLKKASAENKNYYDELVNEAKSYGLKSRMSFSGETFRLHRKTYLKITISGKSVKVYFALNAKEYENSTIPLIDYSSRNSKAETPSALWIKSDLALKRAKGLIKEACAKDNLLKK